MTPAEHYAQAEALLVSYQVMPGTDHDPAAIYPAIEDGANSIGNALAAAQVHATLSLHDPALADRAVYLRELADRVHPELPRDDSPAGRALQSIDSRPPATVTQIGDRS